MHSITCLGHGFVKSLLLAVHFHAELLLGLVRQVEKIQVPKQKRAGQASRSDRKAGRRRRHFNINAVSGQHDFAFVFLDANSAGRCTLGNGRNLPAHCKLSANDDFTSLVDSDLRKPR